MHEEYGLRNRYPTVVRNRIGWMSSVLHLMKQRLLFMFNVKLYAE